MIVKRTRKEWQAIYDQFLQSIEWSEKRYHVLKRAHHTCECCLKNKATEVHHVVYPQRKDGAITFTDFVTQPNWQLRAICSPCHITETAKR